MLALIVVSILIGFALIFLIRRSSPPIAMEPAYYEESPAALEPLGELHPEEFKELCLRLLEVWGLEAHEVLSEEPGKLDIVAAHPHPVLGGTYLVHGILAPTDQIVDSAPVIGLSDTVRHERALKGILITTGYFSQEVDKILEGSPVELINCKRLADLLEEYGIQPPTPPRLTSVGDGEDGDEGHQ